MNRHRLDLAQALTYASAALLVGGLLAPCITVTPRLVTPLGDVMKVWRLFSSTADPRSFSVLAGLMKMFGDGDLFIALLITAFSIFFPIWKLLAMHAACSAGRNPGQGAENLRIELDRIGHLGRWSMLDVFVLGLAVLAYKTNPDGTTVTLELGAYLFCASVLTGMFAVGLLKKAVLAPPVES